MRVEAFTFGRGAVVREGLASVVLRLDNGTPFAAAVELAPGGPVQITTVNDPNFASELRKLGVHETVVAESLDKKLILPHQLPKLA